MKIRKFVNFNGNISFELITDPIKIVSKNTIEERKITLLRKFEYCLHYPIIIIVKKEWKNRFFFV